MEKLGGGGIGFKHREKKNAAGPDIQEIRTLQREDIVENGWCRKFAPNSKTLKKRVWKKEQKKLADVDVERRELIIWNAEFNGVGGNAERDEIEQKIFARRKKETDAKLRLHGP